MLQAAAAAAPMLLAGASCYRLLLLVHLFLVLLADVLSGCSTCWPLLAAADYCWLVPVAVAATVHC